MRHARFIGAALVIGLVGGCDFVDDWVSTKRVARGATFHLPPQIEAGRPFTIFADFDANCSEEAEVTASADETAKTLSLMLTQWLDQNGACPAAYVPMRTSTTMTLSMPGTYRVLPSQLSNPLLQDLSTTVEVLPAGQAAPAWTPAPLNEGFGLGLNRRPTGAVTGRVVDRTTGAGIASAEVTVENVNPPVLARTATDGRFTLSDVPQGDQVVTVAKEGFEAPRVGPVVRVMPHTATPMNDVAMIPSVASPAPSRAPSL